MTAVLSNALIDALLRAGTAADGDAAAGPLDGATLHLYKTSVVLTPETVKGDLEECDFTGYAASAAVVWTGPNEDADALHLMLGDLKTFACTAQTVSNTVYGWYLLSGGTGTPLMASGALDDPITPFTGQIIPIVPEIGLANVG